MIAGIFCIFNQCKPVTRVVHSTIQNCANTETKPYISYLYSAATLLTSINVSNIITYSPCYFQMSCSL